jgi:hypothetical protein
MGLRVSQPYGDSASHDAGMECHFRRLQLQVKSVTYRDRAFTRNVACPVGCVRVRVLAIDLIP